MRTVKADALKKLRREFLALQKKQENMRKKLHLAVTKITDIRPLSIKKKRSHTSSKNNKMR